ncbi:hypothetical protein J2S90_002113, partial [Arthrobacter bambusae]|nr:hypothetical protein [Arthrobacter bambusae]MDQ0129970.1 hypothetical protein [Arthrobacter bambusae]MDQ0181350.1 hypothetical protein [Arthrobacter bambusae]
ATLSFQSLATPKFARQHWEAGTIHTHVLSYNPAVETSAPNFPKQVLDAVLDGHAGRSG